jgi:hypothetical protein
MLTAAAVIIALALLPIAIRNLFTGAMITAWLASKYGRALTRVLTIAAVLTVAASAGVLYLEDRDSKQYQLKAARERAHLRLRFPNGPELIRLRHEDGSEVYVLPEERIDYIARGYEDPVHDNLADGRTDDLLEAAARRRYGRSADELTVEEIDGLGAP